MSCARPRSGARCRSRNTSSTPPSSVRAIRTPGSRVRWAVKDMRASLDKVGNLADELQQKLDAVSDAVAIPEPEEF